MLKTIKILLLTLLLSGCTTPLPFYTINPEFQPYYDYFKEVYSVKITTPIEFANLPNNWVGLCHRTGSGNYIEIDKKAWPNFSKKERISLIFHEIGHCRFKLKHRDKLLPDYCSSSIMSTHMNSEYCMNKHYDHYLEELL